MEYITTVLNHLPSLSNWTKTNNGKTKNNPQMKGKEESSERMLNEMEVSQLSDTEFKAMVIRKLNELT